ncbi:hypothetical protein BITS_1792 [Bifidobacterium tsurumiense]|uniref:Uncharacterized protein n=1 Tax=Bifidobacterium tsurumiense TaxID=356829 RepID=A0A087EDD7_9BIFI|nr:hypothetical protein BITS_1792 [Bifidobacterium tsurumiense]
MGYCQTVNVHINLLVRNATGDLPGVCHASCTRSHSPHIRVGQCLGCAGIDGTEVSIDMNMGLPLGQSCCNGIGYGDDASSHGYACRRSREEFIAYPLHHIIRHSGVVEFEFQAFFVDIV